MTFEILSPFLGLRLPLPVFLLPLQRLRTVETRLVVLVVIELALELHRCAADLALNRVSVKSFDLRVVDKLKLALGRSDACARSGQGSGLIR